ncbi:MAG TPA: FHA domain-containing protein [Myxococcales bacterium]|nr:FHA domain-containing protein [Myxococcales bacterium]
MGEEATPKTEMINPALLDGVSANFIVKGPSGVEKSYPMRQLAVTIGRSDQCDISVKDSSMSGRHAEISKINGEIKVRALGSANGIYLNGERVEEGELFDGDVLRLGQTSVRIDVVGGRKRPEGALSAKLVGLIVGAVVLLAAGGIFAGLTFKKRAQHKRDLASIAKFVGAAREGQKSKPCAAGVVIVQDVAKTLNSLPRINPSSPPKGEEARRIVAGYRDLAQKYNAVAVQTAQFASKDTENAQTLAGVAEQIADPDLKAKVGETQELMEARSQVTSGFISNWKKLSQATAAFAGQAEQALLQGNKALLPQLERGVPGKTPSEILVGCNRDLGKANGALEEKLKELEDAAGGDVSE